MSSALISSLSGVMLAAGAAAVASSIAYKVVQGKRKKLKEMLDEW